MSKLLRQPKGQKCENCRYFVQAKHAVREGVCLQEPFNVAVEDRKGINKNFHPKWKKDWCLMWETEKKTPKDSLEFFGKIDMVDKTEVER